MMKTTIVDTKLALVCVLLVLLAWTCNSKKQDLAHEAEEYTCPMHPQVVQNKPGNCPVCGMDLVKNNNKGSGVAMTEELKDLVKPTNSSIVATIKTTRPERKSLTSSITAPGVIGHDTRRTYSIPIRFSGRIEKLYVKYNYQSVTKGEVIMEIYSPEMLTAQRELLYMASESKNDQQLLQSAKQKLSLLGLTEQQIETIIISGKELFALPVLSPFTGYILESSSRGNAVQSSTESAEGMDATKNGAMVQPPQAELISSSPTSSQQISIREGMYVTTGQSLFKVVDGNHLWAELYFRSTDAGQIKKGDTIDLEVKGSDGKISSRVDFVQPFFNEGNQFVQARSYLSADKNKLRIGQLITGKVSRHQAETLWIPKEAVLDLGVQQVAFLKVKDTFAPVKIKTGAESDHWIEIIEGLDEQSEIAANAQYLVDSESFIKVTNQ